MCVRVQRTVWGMKVTAIWVLFSSWLLVARAWGFGTQKFGWTKWFFIFFLKPTWLFRIYLLQVHRRQALVLPLFSPNVKLHGYFVLVFCACVFIIKCRCAYTGKSSILLLSQFSFMSVSLKQTHTFDVNVERWSTARFLCFQPQVRRPLWSSLVGNDCRNCTVIFLYSSKCSLIGKKIYKYINIYEYINCADCKWL